MIGIVDCNVGNIGSLRNALAHVGAESHVVSDPAAVMDHAALILPGVGAFDPAMDRLREGGFVEPLQAFAAAGRPMLGICLGLHLFCERSEEGLQAGLGIVRGGVQGLGRLGCGGKVPHVGFNAVDAAGSTSPLLQGLDGRDFYFVHSFALGQLDGAPAGAAVAHTSHGGGRFVSAFHIGHAVATQFHPEKSGEAGLELLAKFVAWSKSA